MSASRWSPGRHLAAGSLVLLLGMGGFVAWSLATEIEGAVVASGEVKVEARLQAIQHPDGGIVDGLHVREGMRVAAGDPILTLDGAELAVQAAVARRRLAETLARMDRLFAEIREAEAVAYREELRGMGESVEGLDAVLAEETALFEARGATLRQSDAQLVERQVQSEAVIAGRERQLAASRRQLELILEDLEVQESLFERGLAERSQVSLIRREAARLEGAIGEFEAGIAETRSAIAGFEIERLRQRSAFREAAQGELRELQRGEAELRERLRLVETQVGRLVLRAPMDGVVLGLKVHTIGGVVPSGAEIAGIVPTDVPLILSVEIDPAQVDRVRAGQGAMLRFPNFDSNTTPDVEGEVASLSADAMTDAETGRRYFSAELTLEPGAEDILGGVELLPGMPVEAFISTGARSPASFLLKPIADYWAYAMREE